MASINGITVKAIKEFRGHDGEPLAQGNLYLNNKKIGFWSQDSWGGPDHFQLEPQYNERLLNDAVLSLNGDKARRVGSGDDALTVKYDLEMLIFDCMNLIRSGA